MVICFRVIYQLSKYAYNMLRSISAVICMHWCLLIKLNVRAFSLVEESARRGMRRFRKRS